MLAFRAGKLFTGEPNRPKLPNIEDHEMNIEEYEEDEEDEIDASEIEYYEESQDANTITNFEADSSNSVVQSEETALW